jgi:signal transduction histidine kinase
VYKHVLASMNLGVIVFDLARGRLTYCNPWARSLLAAMGVADDVDTLRELLLRHGPRPPGTVLRPRPLRIGRRILGYTVHHGSGVAWVFLRDVTDKTRLEAIAAAIETTNNIGYVFSAVRHEIGNPVNSIKVALGVLAANIEEFSRDTIVEYVQRMSTEIGRIERLLRTFRTFSAFERPEVELVSLEPFFHDFLALLRPETEARGIRLATSVPESALAVCDPRALHHVLLNLITNAYDALVGCAAPRLLLRVEMTGSLVVLRVEDNGAGIPEEQRARLFTPFSTTKPNGTGLGLVIARKLLAAMDGTISIESEEGCGTVVSIALPSGDPASSRHSVTLP